MCGRRDSVVEGSVHYNPGFGVAGYSTWEGMDGHEIQIPSPETLYCERTLASLIM